MASSPTSTSLATPAGVLQYHDADCENSIKTVYAAGTTVYAIKFNNSSNSARTFLKMWDSASALVLGTDVPDMIVECNGSGTDGGITTISFVSGKTFATGLQLCATTTAALAGSTSPSSSAIIDLIHVPV